MDIDDETLPGREARERAAIERFPIIYVPGYGAPPFHSRYFRSRLEVEGFDVFQIELPKFQTGDIVKSATILGDEVQRARERYQTDKVSLIGHSLGGIISRYYLQQLGGWKYVHRAVYLATPQKGVYVAALGVATKAARQLMPNSKLITDLNNDPARCRTIKCLSIISNFDEVVSRQSGILDCGYNKAVNWPVGHWGLVFSNKAIGWIVDFLDGLFDIREGFVSITEDRAREFEDICAPGAKKAG